MTTEPNQSSIDAIAQSLMAAEPTSESNLNEVADDLILEPQDVEPEIEAEAAESEDVADYESDDDDFVDEDEYADEAAVQMELSDDLELEVKSDGTVKKVTLSELKRGYAGQDYIQKTMEQNAQQRKEVEQLSEVMQQDRQRLAELVNALEQGNAPMRPQQPSKELQNSDPLGYLEAMEQYRQDVAEYDQFQQQTQAELEKARQQDYALSQQYAQQQAELLRQEIPELNDPEKSKQLMTDITDVATNYYKVPQEVLGALTHGWEFKIMRDAVAYRKLQETKGKVEEKTKAARPMVKPGAKQSKTQSSERKRQQARAKMRKDGSPDSVANFLLS
jgi:hypothetical protein